MANQFVNNTSFNKWSNTAAVDGWNYALYSLESILNIAYVLAFNVLFYICISQKNLHLNFRAMLLLTALGNQIRAIHRLILVAARICCIAQLDTPLVRDLHFMQLMGTYLSLFGFMFVVVERAIASAFTSIYEQKCASYAVPIALYGVVAVLSSASACIVWFQLIEGFDMYFLVIEIVTVAVSLLALIAIMLYNKAVYKERHASMMPLTDRYQLDENIRASKYLIPVAINNVLAEVLHIMLMAYSIYFTDIPIGYDTTHLSHAYDLV
ncbi:hypothetical protein Y032_0014g2502 [Ancylostoma ceylanicum]|uniref:7TM GPCR serpentine receptor class x (Srx) domain-containing protein n=1 Tax=Ancylostoma ceylanicum TaxID=53326 RepID=A0A016VAZ8_9BILA|nr:hypothetical protein Y032_0014g2502 [Ancylostoma ceylanicum]